jgi:hypothetical protein
MSKFQMGEYVRWGFDGTIGTVCRIDNEKDEIDVRYTDGSERRFTAESLEKVPREMAKAWTFGLAYGMSPEKLKKIGTRTGRLSCAQPNLAVLPSEDHVKRANSSRVWEDIVKAQELAMEMVCLPAHLIPGSAAVLPEKPKWGEPFMQKGAHGEPKTKPNDEVDYADLELRVLASVLNRGVDTVTFLDYIGLVRPSGAVSEASLQSMRDIAKKFKNNMRMAAPNAPIQGSAADSVRIGEIRDWNPAVDVPINEDWAMLTNQVHDELEATMIKTREDKQYTELKDLLARQMGFDPVTVTHEQLVAELKGETEERMKANIRLCEANCNLSKENEELKQKLMIHGDNAQTWWDSFRKPK